MLKGSFHKSQVLQSASEYENNMEKNNDSVWCSFRQSVCIVSVCVFAPRFPVACFSFPFDTLLHVAFSVHFSQSLLERGEEGGGRGGLKGSRMSHQQFSPSGLSEASCCPPPASSPLRCVRTVLLCEGTQVRGRGLWRKVARPPSVAL